MKVSRERNNDIETRLGRIFIERFGIDPEKLSRGNLNCELIGPYFKLAPRDLLYLFFDIENSFEIKIPEYYVIDGKFNSINNIVNMLEEILSEKKIMVI